MDGGDHDLPRQILEMEVRVTRRASHSVKFWYFALSIGLVLALAVAAGCGSDDGDDSAPAAGEEAAAVEFETVTPDTLTVCADMEFPPVEFYDEGHVATGSEIDLGREIATKLNLKHAVHQVQFNGIVPALLSKKCDVITAGLYPTPERGKVIDFVMHSQNGQSLMVRKGNPLGITGFDETVAGKKLGMISGYATIDGVKEECEKVGAGAADPCRIVLFGSAGGNVSALKADKVDGLVDSTTSVGWYSKQNPEDFEPVKGAGIFLASKVAFGIRKNEPEIKQALQDSVDELYETGWMCQNLAKWGIETTALPPHSC
jgi:polar amino acid transport system substrate-binding protein